jgi:ATP-binding protein involved in chromosome partitioning
VITIAVPLMRGSFSDHFGGADAFALYRVDEARRTVDGREVLAPPEHGRGVYPMWLRQLGATVVLAGGMGPRASGMFTQHGIQVVLGVEGNDPDVVVRSYLDGTLVATGEPCHDHSFHDCGHHSPREGGCGGHHQDD